MRASTFRLWAPNAKRTPISRVRSVTLAETYTIEAGGHEHERRKAERLE
jgi:hypothetical protein